ncbi:sulfite exporter TauE/SafE family protein [Alloacidobacterium dinghuense]|uniref:Probable membrane transporter protein n=1 Tax=Alloacidobacterium dinghuense TaxID=2763107 RepID=A0A7G8BE47_9BACT|nr:sulfite exporter TauE/SafE family protein [Alloacidobacterium dinghuense]QNI30817.1 sulfite exporter TauE/SafE family protein [Alloacidobacterium dinghuense]
MELAIGFLIAFAIAVTGVGAGTITAPILVIFLHVPLPLAVGTALVYSAIVKLIVVPIQMWRKQVNYRAVGYMLLGGLPGVIIGVWLFRSVVQRGHESILYAALGSIIVITSGWHLYRTFRKNKALHAERNHPKWLGVLMLPIGAEVGFSSSGAGALGTIALLGLTTLSASQIVGTDLAFGLCLSLVGGGLHLLSQNLDAVLLAKLLAGGFFGAIAGSALAPKLPNQKLRLVLTAWLLMIGMQFCYQAVHSHTDAQSKEKHLASTAVVQPALLQPLKITKQ